MKHLIVNTIMLFVIFVGGFYLLNSQTAYANNIVYDLNATCTCNPSGGGTSTCSGNKCECKENGSCSSCDRFLGIFGCKIK